jgi:hypothetical protein
MERRSAGFLGEELTNSRHQIVRDLHEGLARVFVGGLVLGHSLLFSLALIMGEHPLDPLFVPSRWELALLYHDIFLRRRRLYVLSGFPFSSYAVMTNTLSGSGSGT